MRFEFLTFDTPFGAMAVVWGRSSRGPLIHRVLLPGTGIRRELRESFPGASEGDDPEVGALADAIRLRSGV